MLTIWSHNMRIDKKTKVFFMVTLLLSACAKPDPLLFIDEETRKSELYGKIFHEDSNHDQYGELIPLGSEMRSKDRFAAYQKIDQFILRSLNMSNAKQQLQGNEAISTPRHAVFTFENKQFPWTDETHAILKQFLLHYDFTERPIVNIYSHQTNDAGLILFERLVDAGIKPYDIQQNSYVGNLKNLSPYSVLLMIDFNK